MFIILFMHIREISPTINSDPEASQMVSRQSSLVRGRLLMSGLSVSGQYIACYTVAYLGVMDKDS